MPATGITRHDHVIDDLDTEDAPGRHEVPRCRDILLSPADSGGWRGKEIHAVSNPRARCTSRSEEGASEPRGP